MVPGLSVVCANNLSLGLRLKKTIGQANISFPLSWPVGIVQAGDLAVFVDMGLDFGDDPPASVTPSGFTKVSDFGGGTGSGYKVRGIVSYRVCNGSESGSIAGMGAGSAILFLFTGGIASVSSSTWDGLVTNIGAGPPAQLVASSGGNAPLIVFGAAGGPPGSANLNGSSPDFQHIVNTSRLTAGCKVYTSSPVNHSVDTSLTGTTAVWLTSGYLEVTLS